MVIYMLIVDGVVRFSVIAEQAGQEIVNVVDVDVHTGIGETREEAAERLCGRLLNCWHDFVLTDLSAQQTALEVRWIDLNSEDGSTGGRSSTSEHTWPAVGGNSAPAFPNNVVLRLRKNLANSSRITRRGELRLCGLTEDATAGAGNQLIEAYITGWTTNMEDFLEEMNSEDGLFETQHEVVQVHNRRGEDPTKSKVLSFTPIGTVGTQRRRMPGYGS